MLDLPRGQRAGRAIVQLTAGSPARVDVESWAGGRMGSIAVTDNTHDAMLSRVQRLDEVSEAPRVGRKSASGREQRSRPSGLGISGQDVH